MSKLTDIQNVLVDLNTNITSNKKADVVDIIDELLQYIIKLEREVISLIQNRSLSDKSQGAINYQSLRLDSSPFKINPLNA